MGQVGVYSTRTAHDRAEGSTGTGVGEMIAGGGSITTGGGSITTGGSVGGVGVGDGGDGGDGGGDGGDGWGGAGGSEMGSSYPPSRDPVYHGSRPNFSSRTIFFQTIFSQPARVVTRVSGVSAIGCGCVCVKGGSVSHGLAHTIVNKSACVAAIGLPAPPEPRKATGWIGHVV